jgi:hypothetical protein
VSRSTFSIPAYVKNSTDGANSSRYKSTAEPTTLVLHCAIAPIFEVWLATPEFAECVGRLWPEDSTDRIGPVWWWG